MEIKVTGDAKSAQPFVVKYKEELTELGKIEAKKNLDWRLKNMHQPWVPSFVIEIDGRQYVHIFKDVD